MKTGFDTRTPNDPASNQPAPAPPSVEEIAKLFPQLEVIELLGRGGMGVVYKARQPRLNRFVALKIVAPERQNDPQFAERFEREARALASLTHPNIVAVYDFGEAQGSFYLLMEFVDGMTLRQLLQAKKLSPPEALNIVEKICEALHYAHEQGIVHRDMKPENILIDKNGGVKIADFGIAKILDQPAQDISLTGAREVIGTAHYMAPEQFERPQTVDCRADIYSVGVMFYEMLTGELPIGKFPPPSTKAQADARVDTVVMHALEKEPENRYQTANQMKADVEAIEAGPAPPMQPAPAVARPPIKTFDSGKIVVVVGSLGFVGLVGLFCFALFVFKTNHKATPVAVGGAKADTNAFWNRLNENQRLVAQYGHRKFHDYFDERTFDGWSDAERTALERRLIDTLKGPVSEDTYHAINSLAALHSTNALPLLRQLALDPETKIAKTELGNRPRWMAVRVLGLMGDKSAVPQMIHLLYHDNSNVRWWSQITLVRLTGQNYSEDWKAWGQWWNSQHGQPPFDPTTVRWWPGQGEPGEMTRSLADGDHRFIVSIGGNPTTKLSVDGDPPIDTRDFSISGDGFTIEALNNDATAFLNRDYVWQEVPKNLLGWHYTQTFGGKNPQIKVRARRDAVLQIVTAIDQAGLNLSGWEQTPIEFRYSARKESRMVLFQKRLAAGLEIDVPQ